MSSNSDKRRRLTYSSAGLPAGTVFNFDYTGTVQEVELPKGRYKLQCWGAQGGASPIPLITASGSKGGYSEGYLNLDSITNLYVFVGGKPGNSPFHPVPGGWNGGGNGVGQMSIMIDSTNYVMGCGGGGGGTDIRTISSSDPRSLESLLSRFIVAGGGGGGSNCKMNKVSVPIGWREFLNRNSVSSGVASYGYYIPYGMLSFINKTVRFTATSTSGNSSSWMIEDDGVTINLPNGNSVNYEMVISSAYTYLHSNNPFNAVYYYYNETEQYTSTDYSSSKNSQGGGESGKGMYPGTQSTPGYSYINGGFGYGADQTMTSLPFIPGGSGGGWYGGGIAYSDVSSSYINYNGGGSGFVNISSNSQYQPVGYSGLPLESGTTIDGSKSFEAPSGGTETGHAGNGYARITVL